MLGVAVLLASSSMAAIELITLYARLDNAVHKMAPPPLASHLSLRLLATEKTWALLLKNLYLRSPLFLSRYALPTIRRCCSYAEPLMCK